MLCSTSSPPQSSPPSLPRAHRRGIDRVVLVFTEPSITTPPPAYAQCRTSSTTHNHHSVIERHEERQDVRTRLLDRGALRTTRLHSDYSARGAHFHVGLAHTLRPARRAVRVPHTMLPTRRRTRRYSTAETRSAAETRRSTETWASSAVCVLSAMPPLWAPSAAR